MNATSLQGRRALVTGGGRGIGAAIAESFAAAGASVCVADLDGPAAVGVAEQIRRAGREAVGICVDVTDPEQVHSMTSTAAEALGGLDTLVANVGVAVEDDFDELTPARWSMQVDATLTSTFLTVQSALPHLERHPGDASIAVIGSVNGLQAYGHEAYSAAKAGLVSLTQNLALRLGGRGVRINLVAPGTILTPAWDDRVAADPDLLERVAQHYPLGRLGRPDDVANACVFLVSPAASWITGATLPVDGGLTAGNLAMVRDRSLGTSDDQIDHDDEPSDGAS